MDYPMHDKVNIIRILTRLIAIPLLTIAVGCNSENISYHDETSSIDSAVSDDSLFKDVAIEEEVIHENTCSKIDKEKDAISGESYAAINEDSNITYDEYGLAVRNGIFADIMGFSGYYEDSSYSSKDSTMNWHHREYYTLFPGKDRMVCIAQSGFFNNSQDYSVDLNHDGTNEFVCNFQYGGDGAERVRVYRLYKGKIEIGEMAIQSLLPEGVENNNRVATRYNSADSKFELSYIIPGSFELVKKEFEGLDHIKFSTYRVFSGSNLRTAAYQSLLLNLIEVFLLGYDERNNNSGFYYLDSPFSNFAPYDSPYPAGRLLINKIEYCFADIDHDETEELLLLFNNTNIRAVRYDEENDVMVPIIGSDRQSDIFVTSEILHSLKWIELTENNILKV